MLRTTQISSAIEPTPQHLAQFDARLAIVLKGFDRRYAGHLPYRWTWSRAACFRVPSRDIFPCHFPQDVWDQTNPHEMDRHLATRPPRVGFRGEVGHAGNPGTLLVDADSWSSALASLPNRLPGRQCLLQRPFDRIVAVASRALDSARPKAPSSSTFCRLNRFMFRQAGVGYREVGYPFIILTQANCVCTAGAAQSAGRFQKIVNFRRSPAAVFYRAT